MSSLQANPLSATATTSGIGQRGTWTRTGRGNSSSFGPSGNTRNRAMIVWKRPRVRALIALQRAVHAHRLGEEGEARVAIADTFAPTPRFAPTRGTSTGGSTRATASGHSRSSARPAERFARALASPSASVEDVLMAGGDHTAFARVVIEAFVCGRQQPRCARPSHGRWRPTSSRRSGTRRDPVMLLSLLTRVARSPHLVRVRSFVKAVLVAAGVWPVVAAARARTSAGPSGN